MPTSRYARGARLFQVDEDPVERVGEGPRRGEGFSGNCGTPTEEDAKGASKKEQSTCAGPRTRSLSVFLAFKGRLLSLNLNITASQVQFLSSIVPRAILGSCTAHALAYARTHALTHVESRHTDRSPGRQVVEATPYISG